MDPYYNYNYTQATNYNHLSLNSQSEVEQNTWNISQKCANKSIYINQNFRGIKNQPLTSNKVLINPNFVCLSKVHINPSYVKSRGIFINPRVITSQASLVHVQNVENTPFNTSDVVISTKNKWVRKSFQPAKNKTLDNTPAISNAPSTSKTVKTPLKYTKYKIIRKESTPKRKRRTSLNLRYKLIRSQSLKPKSPEKQATRNKFKLDRRLSTEKNKSKLYSWNTSCRLRIDYRNVVLKRNSLPNNKMAYFKYVSKASVKSQKGNTRMSRILNISGIKYKMDNNKKVLKLAVTPADINTSKRTVKIRRGDQIKKIPMRIKLRTNNIPCPTYHRFGTCQRQQRGMCQKVHNPDQIALCSKFLQGVCHDDTCLLSHKISPSKMPTCKFYLEGLCTKDGCPYLHVKINSKVAICKQFLAGFCHLGKECVKRHECLCPDFEQDGRCAKRHCQFPHRTVKRQSTNKVKVARSQVKYNKVSNCKQEGKHVKNNSSEKGDGSIKRYYQEFDKSDNSSNVIGKKKNINEGKLLFDSTASNSLNKADEAYKCALINCNEESEVHVVGNNSNDIVQVFVLLSKRPQLGTLPVFIPF